MGIEKVASITQNLHYQFVVFKPLSYCFKETIGFEN